ncbi:MAG: hypothetical protein KDC85_17490 [Saprospiraceae bacterium]|nr:hypothetical protein [Saprospiraceae bacterium]
MTNSRLLLQWTPNAEEDLSHLYDERMRGKLSACLRRQQTGCEHWGLRGTSPSGWSPRLLSVYTPEVVTSSGFFFEILSVVF